MMTTFQLLAAASASLLATAAHAAVLTLTPGVLTAQPGQTAGWGFTLLNDDADNYLVITGTEFSLPPLSSFGSYADLLGPRGLLVLAPQARLSEGYDALLGTGLGEFRLDAAARGRLDGEVRLHYLLSAVDPNSVTFEPDTHIVSFDASVSAQAAVQAVPEPASWTLFGAAAALALVVRRRRSA
jgi:hypothetical protein